MTFNTLIPQPGDNLSKSQQDLLNNNGTLNVWSLKDHYAFNDGTVNSGFHNTVTQPQIITNSDPTTTANPILYSIKRGSSFPVLQYSRGVSNQVPSPVTTIQSPVTPVTVAMNGRTTCAVSTDFNNVAATAVVSLDTSQNVNLRINAIYSPSGGLTFELGGTKQLLLKNKSNANNYNNVYWTLKILRVS